MTLKFFRSGTIFCIVTLIFLGIGDYIWAKIAPVKTLKNIRELTWVRMLQTNKGRYVVDSEIGFRPLLGEAGYTEYGTFYNEYKIELPKEKERVLFIGDSVTSDQIFTVAIQDRFGAEKYEFWNGGVGSYNLEQVLKYYKSILYKVPAHKVVFTFHINDWETTPIFFPNEDGSISAFEPHIGEIKVNSFLYFNSNIYHLYLNGRFSNSVNIEKQSIVIEQQLNELIDLVGREKLSVIFYPPGKQLVSWSFEERRIRDESIRILREQGIQFYDLSSWVDEAVEGNFVDGNDQWHPGPELARYYAEKLFGAGFLQQL